MNVRQLGAVVAAFTVAAAVSVVGAVPADAATYRYWSYWSGTSGSWTFAQRGPTGSTPPDGGVQGWRFAVSVDAANAIPPRLAASSAFTTVCGGTPAESGKKRVALVVDFGTTRDAPPGSSPPGEPLRGTCVVLPTSGTGWDALTLAEYSIRSEGGLVCGLSGYPARGCGEAVDDVASDPTPTPTQSSTTRSDQGSTRGGSSPVAKPGVRGGAGTDGASAAPRATTSASATATASRGAASARATETGIPTAQPQSSIDGDPVLVEGAPPAGSGVGGPLPAIAGVLVLVALGLGAYVRTRRNP